MKAPLSTLLGAAVLQVAACLSARAQLPSGAQVVSGDVNIAQAGNAMTLTQASRNAIVNWQSFNLGAGASLRLQQSGADAAMLARVVGNDPSQLLGSLQADGKLFLINPRGVVIGRDAVIDTAAFAASTLDVSDEAFLRGGALTFQGDSTAGVVNLGQITAREGNVLLFAHTVKNAGKINAVRGTVGLGAGTEVYLASADAPDFLIKTQLTATTEKTGVENSGAIVAAQAQLEAAGGSLYELAVNQSGVVRATGSTVRNGRVLLTAAGGTVGVSGEVSARNADGSGGEILVGGDYRGGNAAVANAARTVVTASATLDASAAAPSATAKAGRVVVWADDATRFLGTLRATGAGGGFAEVSGKRWLDFNPASSVQLGAGGTLLLDPDALVISTAADSGTSTSGTNPFTFGATTTPATLNVTTLQNQLAVSNVILDTSTSSGDITFNSAVTWATNNSLTVRSGNNINLNASLTGGAASTLALYTGREATAPGEQGLEDIRGEATLDSAATISVGKLVYGANAQSVAPAGYTPVSPARSGLLWLNGNIAVDTLEVDLAGGAAGVLTNGTNNAIGAFRTSGSGTLSSAYVADHQGGLDVTLNSETAGGPYLQFITPGTLTLKSGSRLNFDSAGTVLFASTGGAFVNEAGAAVFGANARFLIYSSSTAATTKGGLVGTEVFNHPFSDSDDYSGDAVSRFFYSAASGSPILTYTANDFTRTYGAANPALTYTTTGWQVGVTNDVTGAPALSTSATQSSGVGGYAINISAGTLASSNYDFSFVPGTLTIEKAPLTVTANNATRRVNLDNPTFSASYSGFVLGESTSALGGTLSLTTSAASASPAGSYAITPSGLTAANYAITFVPGVLNITANAALLITADSFTRTYGAANPAFTATYSGFVGGDNASMVTGLQFNTAAMQSSGIGAYTITPFGATATGYDISYAPGMLTIERAPLTISVPNQSRLYGDANNLTANFNGLVNGDTSSVVSGLNLATSATPASNVGTYAITASGASAANYSITYSPGSLSVLPAPLTVTIADATRRYGDADPVFTYAVDGLRNGDAASLVSVNNLSSLATASSGIGSYGIIGFPFVSSANYTVPAQVTGSLTITPRPLTITANSFTRAYGDPNPIFTAAFNGLASFDTPALFGNLALTTQATQSSGVGNWGITFATVANPNYAITSQFGTLTITPAALIFDRSTELSRVYGRANPAAPFSSVLGLKLDDTLNSLGLSFEAPALNADVGTYTYRLTSTNPNYSLPEASGTFRVTPAPLAIAVASTGRIYGDANPSSYDLRVSGLVFDHTTASVVSLSNPTNARSDVGTYQIAPTLLNSNYTIESFTGGAFVISPRELIFTASNRARLYGEANPAFAGFFTGFAVGDSEANVIAASGFQTAATAASSVGTYAINPRAVLASPNYVLTPVAGTLTISPAPITVTIADALRDLGQPNPAFVTANVAGLRNDDTVAAIGLVFSTPATPGSVPGAYSISGAITSPNYVGTVAPGTLTVGIPQDVVDLNHQLDPSRLTQLNGTNQINKDFTPSNETIEVEKEKPLTIAVNPNVDYSTAPLTKADYASYFASFAGVIDAVKTSMAASYQDFLSGKGEKDSAYEKMPAAARALLSQFMSGELSVQSLQMLVASGDGDAASALSFILPTLIERTRDKELAAMTPLDRQILGRLADLTEQRNTATLRLAQQKYEAMVKTNAERAELNGFANLVLGPGDFKAIVEDATQEALGLHLGAVLGTAAVGAGASGLLALPGAAAAIFPHAGYVVALQQGGQMFVSTASSALSGASAGPAIAVGMAIVLAIRATQIADSVKNENDFKALMASWKVGQEITSIAQLKSSASDKDMKLSTLMLAAELLAPTP
jgi:filamentous hemagglutinin family protein